MKEPMKEEWLLVVCISEVGKTQNINTQEIIDSIPNEELALVIGSGSSKFESDDVILVHTKDIIPITHELSSKHLGGLLRETNVLGQAFPDASEFLKILEIFEESMQSIREKTMKKNQESMR